MPGTGENPPADVEPGGSADRVAAGGGADDLADPESLAVTADSSRQHESDTHSSERLITIVVGSKPDSDGYTFRVRWKLLNESETEGTLYEQLRDGSWQVAGSVAAKWRSPALADQVTDLLTLRIFRAVPLVALRLSLVVDGRTLEARSSRLTTTATDVSMLGDQDGRAVMIWIRLDGIPTPDEVTDQQAR